MLDSFPSKAIGRLLRAHLAVLPAIVALWLPGVTPAAAAYEATGTVQVTIELQSRTASGQPAGNAYLQGISGDGNKVLFGSSSPGIVAGAPSGRWYSLYVRDRTTGATQVASAASDGTPARGNLHGAYISAGGRRVLFQSDDRRLLPSSATDRRVRSYVFLKDLNSGRLHTARVPRGRGVQQGRPGDANPSGISASGRYVAVNALYDPAAGAFATAYLYDAVLDRWQQVCPLGKTCEIQALSRDGRFAAYIYRDYPGGTAPGQLFLFDRDSGTSRAIPRGDTADLSPRGMRFSGDGRTLAIDLGEDAAADTIALFRLPDLARTGSVTMPGLADLGGLDWTGRYLAVTVSRDQVPDVDSTYDAYRYDRATGRAVRVSRTSSGRPGNGTSAATGMSNSGATVLLTSYASNFVAGDQAGNWPENIDVFIAGVRMG